MRVSLKGINRITKRLADGRVETYWYAWKGGPRLRGNPGSAEFVLSYNEAVARKVVTPKHVLLSVLQTYQTSQAFLSLGESTRKNYLRVIRAIEKKFGDFPLSALTERRSRGVFMEWRDEIAFRSRCQADGHWTVLSLILSWALNRGLIDANPCTRGGRVYHGSRIDKIWTREQEATFLDRAPEYMCLAYMLAVWTGQREGDLVALCWSAYDGSYIRLQQRKRARPSKQGKSELDPETETVG